MSHRPLGHGNLKRMGDFKAIAMDYAYYLTLSDEGSLYCLTDRQIYILLAQLDYVGWLTRWYNTEDITQTTVGFIRSELELALLSCVDVSIIVEQGKQNLTRNVQQQQIESQRLRDDYQDEYTGDPTSINPDAPTTDFGASGDRLDALCSALMAYVYQAANAQVQAIVASDIAAYALLAGAAVLLIPGLNLFFLAGASLALLAGGGLIGVTTGTAIAALTDTDALNNVVCYMRDTLKAQSVSEANFAAVLNTYPFTPGSHEAIICDFLKGQLGPNYLGMLDMLGQGYAGTTGGDPLPTCPCDAPPEWERFLIDGFQPEDVNCGSVVDDGLGHATFTAGFSYGAYRVQQRLIAPFNCFKITALTYPTLGFPHSTDCSGTQHPGVPPEVDECYSAIVGADLGPFTIEITYEVC